MEFLDPETQEIRDWLMYEGAKNTIIPQYSVDICLQKAGAMERLKSPTPEEFEAIGWLIAEALGGGPCPGLTNPEALLGSFLNAAKERPLDRKLIQQIRDWAEQNLNDPGIARAAEELES